MNIEKAKEIANAMEWSGDIRVNFHTAIKAAKVLADRVELLEELNECSRTTKRRKYERKR